MSGFQKIINPWSPHKQLLDYLGQNNLSGPIEIYSNKAFATSTDLEEKNLTEMVFSPRENCYVNIIEFKKGLYLLSIQRIADWISHLLFLQKKCKLFVNVNLPDFRLGRLSFQSTQAQLINNDRTQILHILMPGADKEWFVNDIHTRKKINDNVKSLKVPKLIASNVELSFFISGYIDSKPLGHHKKLGEFVYFEITNTLVNYYQETSGIQYISFKLVFHELVEQLYLNLCSYDRSIAENIKRRILNFTEYFRNMDQPLNLCEIAYTENVHGDINLRENILRASDGLIYFIDWELSRQANVLYDVLYMLFQDSLEYRDVNNSPLALFFQDSLRQANLLQPFRAKLGLKLKYNELLLYLLITIVDMLNTKVLILKKKRIPALLTEDMVVTRLHGLSKIIDFSEALFCIISAGH